VNHDRGRGPAAADAADAVGAVDATNLAKAAETAHSVGVADTADAADAACEVAVLGLGSPLLGDDALGLECVAELARRPWPAGVVLLAVGTAPLDYLDSVARARHLIVVDAVRPAAGGGAPGSVHRLGLPDLAPSPGGWRDAHGFSLSELVGLARCLTDRPETVVVFGVEIEGTEAGKGLSEPVRRALPPLVDMVAREALAKVSRMPPRASSPPGPGGGRPSRAPRSAGRSGRPST